MKTSKVYYHQQIEWYLTFLSSTSDTEILTLLKLSHGPLEPYPFKYSDGGTTFVHLLDSVKEQVFTSREITYITESYKQLNPDCTIVYVSPFYVSHSRVVLVVTYWVQHYMASRHSHHCCFLAKVW